MASPASKYIIADNLSKAGWSGGCVSAIDFNGRTIWITDAHHDVGKRFLVRADEKLTAFVELESAIRGATRVIPKLTQSILPQSSNRASSRERLEDSQGQNCPQQPKHRRNTFPER
jgi:hypothetical protein